MKALDTYSSTSDDMDNYQQKSKIKKTENFILARIKYLRGLDWYDIVSRKDYDRLMDQLSFNSRRIPCEDEVKDEVFNECPKQLRNGVKIDNIAEIMSKKMHDKSIEQKKRQILEKIFINTISTHSVSRNESILKYLFGFFGISAVFTYLYNKVTQASKLAKLGIQSIHPTQYSSENTLQMGSISSVSGNSNVQASIPGNLFIDNTGLGVFKRNNEIHVENCGNCRQGTNVFGKYFEAMELIMGKGFGTIKNLIIGMFFMRNDVQKTFKFSLGNTIFSLFHILPIGYMVFLLLKDQHSKRNTDEDSKKFKLDEFFD